MTSTDPSQLFNTSSTGTLTQTDLLPQDAFPEAEAGGIDEVEALYLGDLGS